MDARGTIWTCVLIFGAGCTEVAGPAAEQSGSDAARGHRHEYGEQPQFLLPPEDLISPRNPNPGSPLQRNSHQSLPVTRANNASPLTISIAVPLQGPYEFFDDSMPNGRPWPLAVQGARFSPGKSRPRAIGRHLQVIVTNTSSKTQRLWHSYHSWGYDNLRFEVADSTGKLLYTIKKKPVWFTLNNPSSGTLAPGEHFVMDIDLDDTWDLPFLKKKPQGDFRLRLRAVYESFGDKEFKEHNVWEGRVKSPYQDYLLQYRR